MNKATVICQNSYENLELPLILSTKTSIKNVPVLISPIAPMAKQDVYHIQPSGWEGNLEKERFKVSNLDYLTVYAYNNYALFFKLDDAEKSRHCFILHLRRRCVLLGDFLASC